MSENRGFCLLAAFCLSSENVAGSSGVGWGSGSPEFCRYTQRAGRVRVAFCDMQDGREKRLFMRGKVPFLPFFDGRESTSDGK